jgi:beta-N-acetylhexosaminidase
MRDKIGQLFMVEPPSSDIASNELKEFKKSLRENNIGGMLLFDWNLPSVDKSMDLTQDPQGALKIQNQIIDYVNFLQDGSKPGLFVAVDQEGGLVQRLNTSRGFTRVPSAKRVADVGDPALTARLGTALAEELEGVGVNWNLAPTLDLGSNPDSPAVARLKRAFSADPEIASTHGAELIQAMQHAGILTTAKHFPGHGAAGADSHSGRVTIDKPWKEVVAQDLVPFIGAINHDVASVMVGHVTIPSLASAGLVSKDCADLPASLNSFLLSHILRKKLGFSGLVITDDMSMGAISEIEPDEGKASEKAIAAGADMLIVRGGGERKIISHLCARVEDGTPEGRALKDRIDESYERIIKTKDKYELSTAKALPQRTAPVSTPASRAAADEIWNKSETIYGGDTGKRDGYVKPVPGKKPSTEKKPSPMSKGLKDLTQ